MVALSATRLSVISWRKPIEDPIVEWGQLLAYMPSIRQTIGAFPRSVLFLPQPRLDRDNRTTASDAIGKLAAEQATSNAQIRREARETMLRELERRNMRERFESLLAPPRSRT